MPEVYEGVRSLEGGSTDPTMLSQRFEWYIQSTQLNLGFSRQGFPYKVGGGDVMFSAGAQAGAQAGTGTLGPAPKNTREFLDSIAAAAVAASYKYRVPAGITLAQAVLESRSGRSELAARYKNLFGIKGEGPAGSTSMSTAEEVNGRRITIKAGFRVYHNWGESIEDHGRFLTGKRYRAQGIGTITDPAEVARALQRAGYATDSAYASKLINLIDSYDLRAYGGWPATAPVQRNVLDAAARWARGQ